MQELFNTNGNLTLNNTAQSYDNAYNQQVYTVVVNNMGSGYTSQPTVTITSPSGAGTAATAVANWDAVSQTVRSITITDPGSGYRANATVAITSGGGSGAAATAVVLQSIPGNAAGVTTYKNGGTTITGGLTINNSQSVGGISITNTATNNVGYSSAPTVGFGLPVRTILCTDQGSGYTTATVSFSYPSGTVTTPATATAMVVNGKVTSINITNGGVYVGGDGTVNVTINGANTTQATVANLNIPVATANIANGMVTGFNITNSGSDYITAPAVALAGGGFTTVAAAPTCRIGLYNVNYSITQAPTGVAAPVGYTIAVNATTEGPEIPANRKLNSLSITNPKHLTLNNNLELTASSSALGTSNGIISFSGANKTITCTNPLYAGTTSSSSATLPGFVNGIVTLTTPGGTATRSFPVGRGVQIVAGTGTGAFGPTGGCDITSMTAQTDVAPTGSFTTGSYTFTGIRTYNVVKNGTQYGTGPTATLFWGVEDNLASDNSTIHIAQATSTSGSWTVKSVPGTAGVLPIIGSKATAPVLSPGPITYNANDFFTFATNFNPPAALNYVITRTTGNTYNSIASTGSSIPSWAGSVSTETQRSNFTSLSGTTFQYQGVPVTGFILGIDGYFTFNTAFASNVSTVQLGASQFSPITSALAAFWANLGCSPNDFTAASRDASIKYKIDGTLGSGSAIITIEWIHMTGSQNPAQNQGSDLNFQIKLFESDNHIEFNYGLMQGFDGSSQTSWSYACGLNGSFVQAFPAPGQLLALQEHDENTTNFSNEKAQVANAGTNILHTLPECYSSYIFTPGVQIPYVQGSIIPVNDEPAGAIVLTALSSPPSDYCGAIYSSYGATATLSPAACVGIADDDVWFKFIANDPSTAIKVVSSAGYDAVIQVFDASLNPLAPVVCQDTSNDGRVEIAKISGLTISNQYYVRVYHKLGGTQATATATVVDGGISTVTITDPGSGYALTSSGSNGTPRIRVSGGGGTNGVLLAQTAGNNGTPAGISNIVISSIGTGYTSAPTITIDPPSAGLTGDFAIAVYANSPPPANDIICNATPLTVNTGSCVPTSGTTFGATASGGIPSCAAGADDDVFFSFVATALTTSIQVAGSPGFDAAIQVLSSSDNTCNGILSSVICVNNYLAGVTETATIVPNVMIVGNTYFIRVYHVGSGAGSGNFDVCVFESGPPCPTVVSPLGTLAYVGGPTLTWNSVFGATGYDVYFSTVQSDVISGAPAALVSSNQGGTTYFTGPLVNGSVYYWRIDARNAIGASVGCTILSFTATTDIIIGSDATGVCSGNFYDSGGSGGQYLSGENSVTTICPTIGLSTKVTFTSFSTSSLLGGEDALYIYNGNSTASPLLSSGASATVSGFPAGGYYGFSAILPGTSFTSSDASGCLTIKFLSDGGGSNGAGWEANISCESLCLPLPTSPLNNGIKCFGDLSPLSWPLNPAASGYDVYFDTNNPPTTLVSANQSGTTYSAGTLTAGTYYWKVVTYYAGIPCTTPVVWSFTVVDLPVPSATSNSPICAGSTLALFGNNTDPNQTIGNAYLWSGPNGFNDIFQNPTIPNASASANGTYTLTVTNQSGCTASATTMVDVIPLPALNILSQNDVACLGGSDGAFTIEVTNGAGFYLFDENGNINFDGIFTSYAAGSYIVQVTDGNSCESSIGVTIGTISSAPPASSCTITSLPFDACVGNTVSVSTNVVPGATGYTWSAPAGTLINGLPSPQTTVSNTVNITLGTLPVNASSWLICAFASNGCGITNTNCKYIRGALSMPSPISGSAVACPSTDGIYSTTAVGGASGYVWTGTNGITFSGSGLTITANFPVGFTSGNICVAGQLPCGYTGPTRCITVSNGTPLLGVMTGTFTVCPGATNVNYTVPPSAGANSYNWTLPAGATIASGAGTNSIYVNFGAAYTNGNVCVTAQSVCGITSMPRCKTVGSNKPGTPGNIVGAATGICNQTITYSIPSVSGATGYTWTAPSGASVVSGQGTNTVDVTYNNSFTTGNLCVTADNGCGSSTPRCVLMKGTPSNPGVISGLTSVCANDAGILYSIAPVFGATGYVWTTPSGTSIVSGQGTTSLTIDWGTNGGTIGVTASGGCGVSGTRTLNVAMNCRVSGTEIPGAAISAYPNPVSTMLNIELNAINSGSYSIEITDLAGRVISTDVLNAIEGVNTTSIDVAKFAKGVYTLSVKNNEGFAKQIRVVVE